MILSDVIMNMLDSLQHENKLVYENINDNSVFSNTGCRYVCSNSCDGDCEGSCYTNCYGGCYTSCDGGCDGTCDMDY